MVFDSVSAAGSRARLSADGLRQPGNLPEADCRVAHYAECTESEVAALALELAATRKNCRSPTRASICAAAHVGYYLIDRGFQELARRIGYRPPFIEKLRSTTP